MDHWFSVMAAGSALPAHSVKELDDVGFVVIPGPVAPPQLARLAAVWQGTLQAGNRPARIIIKFRPADNGGWTGALYSIDQGFDRGLRQPLVSIAHQGQQLQFVVDGGGAFDGRIAGETIEGTWTQRQAQPLVLRRATPETAWNDPAAHSSQLVPSTRT